MSSQALSVSRRKGGKDARHLMRYLKAKAGMDLKEIARSENVKVREIQKSVQQYEAYEKQNDEGQLQLAVRDLVISVIPTAKDTLTGLLTATTLIEQPNKKTGKTNRVHVEDKTTRLEAVRLVKDLVIGMQPKTPMVAIQNNQNNQPVVTVGSHETNEERMRRLRRQAQEHNLLPAQVAAVPQYIDEGEDAPDDEHEEDEEEEDGD